LIKNNFFLNGQKFKKFLTYGLAIGVVAFMVFVFSFSKLNVLGLGLAGALFLLVFVIVVSLKLQRVVFLIAVGFPLLGWLIYNVFFLQITIRNGIPAGLFFDLFVVIVFFSWLIRKFTVGAACKEEKKLFSIPFFVKQLDFLVVMFLIYVFFNYARGIALGNSGIFSEGRGFLYYLLYFPIVSVFSVELVDVHKLVRFVFYISIVSVTLSFLAAKGIFLPITPSIIAGERGFTYAGSVLVRPVGGINGFFPLFIFVLAFFAFLLPIKRSERAIIIICMLFNLIIILMGNTRSVQLSLLLAVIISVISVRKEYRKRLSRPLFIILLLIIIIPFLWKNEWHILFNRYSMIWLRDPSIIRRLTEIKVFGWAFLKNPVLGNNIGTTQTFYLLDHLNHMVKITTAGPHTEIIYWLYSLGIVGTGLFLFILIVIFNMGLSNIKERQISNPYRLIQKAILITIFVFIIISFSSWQFRSWTMVPVIIAMFAYTRNLYLYSFKLRKDKGESA